MDMMKCVAHRATMTLDEAKAELEKFVQLKTTLRPTFVDVLLNADVVEVVRCKDCKHSDTYPTEADNDMPLKCLGIRYGGVMADWFCEHGERKNGAE